MECLKFQDKLQYTAKSAGKVLLLKRFIYQWLSEQRQLKTGKWKQLHVGQNNSCWQV